MATFLDITIFRRNANIWMGGRDAKTVPSNEELYGISCHFQMSPNIHVGKNKSHL